MTSKEPCIKVWAGIKNTGEIAVMSVINEALVLLISIPLISSILTWEK